MRYEIEVYKSLAEARMEQVRKLTFENVHPKKERMKQRKLELDTQRPTLRTRKVG